MIADIRIALRRIKDDEETFNAWYAKQPQCRDCGYAEYLHPIYGHRFNDGWQK